MFTQCAKCETVFRLSADVLRAAGGQVRCGRCGEVFNALARLAEDADAFPAGESPLEMEARADEILHSIVVPAISQPNTSANETEEPGTDDIELASLHVLDLYDDDPPPAPPTAPKPSVAAKPAEAAKPAVDTKPTVAAKPTAGVKAAPTQAAKPAEAAKPVVAAKPVAANPAVAAKPTAGAKPATTPAANPAGAAKPTAGEQDSNDDGSFEFTLPPGELDRIFVEAPARPRQPSGNSASAPASEAEDSESAEATRNRLSGLEVSEDVRREMLAGIGEPPLPEISVRRSRPLPFALWLGAAIVLALTLGGQLIHANREWLATHAPLRGPLHGMYSALGVALPAPANLSAYQLRQWGVTGEPSASGTLRVRASILNTAAQLQPYPLLRVTLANRFGSRIGAREFEPAEYMGKPTVRMLSPGERADATLDIMDPGKDAEGFEIDVCLRGLDQKIACAGDAASQAKQ